MKTVMIGRGSQTLTLTRSDDHLSSLVATLVDGTLTAEGVIEGGYEGFAQLGTFFVGLATQWRGWNGEALYRSLEHHLELRAAHKGHAVVIDVTLRDAAIDGWTACSTFIIEPGEELSRIASDMEDLSS
jgi:hypothetical protein